MKRVTTLLFLAGCVATANPGAAQVAIDCVADGGADCTALIPDANVGVPGILESTIVITDATCNGPEEILDLNLSVTLIHDWLGDLRLTLVHPDGSTEARLMEPAVGLMDDDLDATFNDEQPAAKDIPAISGILTPATPLSVFDGLGVNGLWTLRIEDIANSGYGALENWSLALSCGLPTVNLTAADPAASEPGIDTGTFTISRGEANSGDLTVIFTVGGTATPGSDYTPLSGSVVIPDGSIAVSFDVVPLDDTLFEGPETVVLELTPDGAYTVGPASQATVTITDDGDPVPAAAAIPTGSPLALLLFAFTLLGAGWLLLRRRTA